MMDAMADLGFWGWFVVFSLTYVVWDATIGDERKKRHEEAKRQIELLERIAKELEKRR